MRTIGFILLAIIGIANLVSNSVTMRPPLLHSWQTLKRRLPPVPTPDGFINLGAFRNPAFSVYCVAGFMCYLGLYTVLTYIEVSADAANIDANFAFYLISIANAASAVGRLASGVLADRFGAMNVMIPFTALAGVLTYVWPLVKSQAGYAVLAVFYGMSSGAFVSLIVSPVMIMGEIQDVGRRVGMYFTISAIGALCGPPISGAINKATDGFGPTGIYAGASWSTGVGARKILTLGAGTAVMVAVLLLIWTRHIVLERLWGKF